MRATLATVAALFLGLAEASSHLTKVSPKQSFYKQSVNRNKQPDGANIVMIVGFVLFGLAYLYTVVAIFLDTKNRGEETDAQLENDL